MVGVPLKTDAATSNILCPSLARVCVELDVSKEQPTKVYIQSADYGFHQTVEFEDRPLYFTNCRILGHAQTACSTKVRKVQPSSSQSIASVPAALPISIKKPSSRVQVQKHQILEPAMRWTPKKDGPPAGDDLSSKPINPSNQTSTLHPASEHQLEKEQPSNLITALRTSILSLKTLYLHIFVTSCYHRWRCRFS